MCAPVPASLEPYRSGRKYFLLDEKRCREEGDEGNLFSFMIFIRKGDHYVKSCGDFGVRPRFVDKSGILIFSNRFIIHLSFIRDPAARRGAASVGAGNGSMRGTCGRA